MKQSYYFIIAAFFCWLLPFRGLAQNKSQLQHLVIEIPGIDEKRGFPELKSTLESLSGVYVTGFCRSQQIIYATYDATIITDKRTIMNALRATHYRFYFKDGVTIEQASAACKDIPAESREHQ